VPLPSAGGTVRGQSWARKGLNGHPHPNLPRPSSLGHTRHIRTPGSHADGPQTSGTVRAPVPSPAGPPEEPQRLTGFLHAGHTLLRWQDRLDLKGHELGLLQLLQGGGCAAPEHAIFHLEGERGQAPTFPFHTLPLPLVGCGHVGDHL